MNQIKKSEMEKLSKRKTNSCYLSNIHDLSISKLSNKPLMFKTKLHSDLKSNCLLETINYDENIILSKKKQKIYKNKTNYLEEHEFDNEIENLSEISAESRKDKFFTNPNTGVTYGKLAMNNTNIDDKSSDVQCVNKIVPIPSIKSNGS